MSMKFFSSEDCRDYWRGELSRHGGSPEMINIVDSAVVNSLRSENCDPRSQYNLHTHIYDSNIISGTVRVYAKTLQATVNAILKYLGYLVSPEFYMDIREFAVDYRSTVVCYEH